MALDEAGKEIGPAQTRSARGLTYILPVKGAFSYRVKGALQAPVNTLQSDSLKVLPGQKVAVRGGTQNTLQIPTDAKPNTHLWLQSGGQWIDFQVIPLTDTTLSIQGNKLRLSIQSNLDETASFTLGFENQSKVVAIPANAKGEVEFDLEAPSAREIHITNLSIRAGDSQQKLQRVLLSEHSFQQIMPLPEKWESGMRLRGKNETSIDDATRARVADDDAIKSGGVTKKGLTMHPPYQGATGFVFAKYAPLTLPAQPAIFRASVGKRDGSLPGDGIWFKVAVVEGNKQTIVAEQVVKTFEWKPIEADFSPWAGKQIQIQLIADPGPADNTEADWAAWAEMRLESKERVWSHRLSDDLERYQFEPGPFPAKSISVEELRSAKVAKLHYQGLGVSAEDSAYAVGAGLNGTKVGFLSGAAGREAEGIWADASILLPVEAIRSLDKVNSLTLDNPLQDYFAIRRFWIELQLADGRKVSSQISSAAFTQPPTWPHGTGIRVPFGEKIRVDILF